MLPRVRFYSSGKKIVFLSVVKPCTLIDRYQLFGGTYSLHLQLKMGAVCCHSIFRVCDTLNLQAACHFCTISFILWTAWQHTGFDSPEYSLIIISLCDLSAKSPTWECAVFSTDIAEPSGFMGPTSNGRPQWSCHGLQSVTSARWRMVWWVILLL